MSTSPSNTHLQIDPTAHVADKAQLISSSSDPHPIIIGAECVIHPFAKLDSSKGPIALGQRSVVWEKATLGGEKGAESRSRPTSQASSAAEDEDAVRVKTISIGDGTVIHPHARIAGPATIGGHCNIGTAVEVGSGVVLGENVTVASGIRLPVGLVLEKGSVVFGEGQVRRPNPGASESVRRDLERAKELKEANEEKHRALTKKLVKGTAGGTRFTA